MIERKLNIEQHAVERSLERLGMTGVELLRELKVSLKEKDLYHTKPKKVWTKVKGKTVVLIMVNNRVITLWRP